MTEMNEKIDYKALQQKALEQFKAGKSLVGKNGAFAPLIKQLLEAALEAELEEHIAKEEEPNRKNGKVRKTIKTADGQFELETSRDRNGSFEPELIKKRETVLAEQM